MWSALPSSFRESGARGAGDCPQVTRPLEDRGWGTGSAKKRWSGI